MQDPFGEAPAEDEAQQEAPVDELFTAPPADEPPPAAAEPPAKKAPAKKAAGTVKAGVLPGGLPVQVNQEGKVVLTFKGGTGFDAPWIVIHAADLQDAHSQVTGDNAALLAQLMERAQKAGQHFASQGASAGSNGGGRGGNTQQRQSAPQGAQEPPSWAPPKPYDDFVFKSGVSKAGKPWQAWMPPTKEDQREPKFFYPPR